MRSASPAGVAALFGVFLFCLSPSVHWLDGGELTAAAFLLAPAHPPGEAAYVVLGRLFSLLPIGSVAFRTGLLSAVGGAIVGWVAFFLAEGVGRKAGREAASPCASLIAVFAALLSYPVWIQCVRTEVYALQAALALGSLAAAFRAGIAGGTPDLRYLALTVFLIAVNGAVHPLLGILAGLPIGLVALLGGHLRARSAGWLSAVGLLGFSVQIVLPMRSGVAPQVGWGGVLRHQELIDFLLARTFTRNFSPLTWELLSNNLVHVLSAVHTHTGPIPMLLAPVGLALLARKSLRAALLVGGTPFCLLWSVLPQNKVFAQNPDFHGYLMEVYVLLWILALIPLQLLERFLAGRGTALQWFPVPLLGVLALPPVLLSREAADRSGDYLPREHGLAALKNLPAGSYLQVSGNNTMFILEYLGRVEARRPDVRVLSRTLLTHPWYRRRLERDEGWCRHAAGPAHLFWPWVEGRELRVELRPLDLPGAAILCPAPAPGWGYYDVRPCPELQAASSRPIPSGLSTHPGAWSGPEALVVGLNARLLLADYYDAMERADWAQEERMELDRLAPGISGESGADPGLRGP